MEKLMDKENIFGKVLEKFIMENGLRGIDMDMVFGGI
jgi:hypothetical protein